MPSLDIFQSQNTFVAIVDLPEGEHQYKFYVDGQWTHDPAEVRDYSHSDVTNFLSYRRGGDK